MRAFNAAAEYARIMAAEKPARASKGTPERDFQRAALRWLRLVLPQGSLVAASVNEQRGTGRTDEERMRYGAARKASGVLSGWPDLTLVVAGGPVVFAELKSPKGVLSNNQREVHERLRRAGHPVVVVRSIDDFRSALRDIGVQTREAA